MFQKCICSLDSQVSVSTEWEIKTKTLIHFFFLNICWAKRYFRKTLTKFSSEWKKLHTLPALPDYQTIQLFHSQKKKNNEGKNPPVHRTHFTNIKLFDYHDRKWSTKSWQRQMELKKICTQFNWRCWVLHFCYVPLQASDWHLILVDGYGSGK